jgi:Tol biopolymer transport system component
VVRRVETAVLATVVLAGSVGGVLLLNRAFRGEGGTTPGHSPAKNGLIVVSFGDDGGTHLYLQNPDNSSWDPRDHQLTNDLSKDSAPAVSPDGRRIAFVREGLEGGGLSVWTMMADGSDLRKITPKDWNANFPTWSPDGKQIAFIGGYAEDIGVYVTNVEGNSILRRLPASIGGVGVGLSWSPDADRIAVAISNGTEGSSISIIDVASGELTLETPALWSVSSPAWSPDGKQLTFAQGGGIVLASVEGGNVVELTKILTAEEAAAVSDRPYEDSQPTWSPDGRWIAFERSFSPSETFVYAMQPNGTDLHRIGLGGDPAWSVAQPEGFPDEGTQTDTPSPADQTVGLDIGLGFDLCRLEALNGIDFLGDGANGTAWVGTRLAKDGSCPPRYEGESIVAVDVDGDGSAESWAGPLARCVGCSPFDTTDLNADGTLELVVTLQYSSVIEYTLFALQPAPGNGPPELQQVTVAEPGSLPNFRAGKPVSLWAGGDEGYSARIECENYPEAPVLIVTTGDHPVEGPGSETRSVERTRLVLGTDATISVQGTDRFTEPTNADPSAVSFTGRACGVDFYGLPT